MDPDQLHLVRWLTGTGLAACAFESEVSPSAFPRSLLHAASCSALEVAVAEWWVDLQRSNFKLKDPGNSMNCDEEQQ